MTTEDAGSSAAVRPRRADAERSIAAILDAAITRVPQDGGYNMTTIARTAGVSRVTLYAHFPTREALVDATVRRATAQAAEHLGDLPLESGPPAARVAELLRSSWQVLATHTELCAVSSMVLSPGKPHGPSGPVIKRVEDLIRRGQAEGAFRADLPAEWLLSASQLLMHVAAGQVRSGQVSVEKAGELLATSVLALLGPVG